MKRVRFSQLSHAGQLEQPDRVKALDGKSYPGQRSAPVPAPEPYDWPDETQPVLPPAGQDRADAILAEIDQAARPAAEPEPWTDEENDLYTRLTNGETIVVSMRDGRHARLIEWADERGLYVRIDRRTPWGNPFEMPGDGDRDTVIENYRTHYLPCKPSLMSRLGELRGKALGCWCAPEPCHGDVLRASAEGGR